MPLSFYRMRDEVALGLIAAVFIAFFVVIVPNYQKFAYQNTEPKAYKEHVDNAGYPAAEGFPTVNSIAEIQAREDENFTIEMDVSKLQEIDLYMDIKERTFSTSNFMRNINNDDFGGVGRFFVAELASGEKTILFLDDMTLDLPKQGTVTLPIGKVVNLKVGGNLSSKLSTISGLEDVAYYIDMAGEWRESEEAQSFDMARWFIAAAIIVVLWIVFSRIFIKLGEKK